MSHLQDRWEWNWRSNNLFQENRNSPMWRQFTLHIICINFQVVFLRITSENVRPLTKFMKKYIYWIKVGVVFKRNSFIREDAAFCSVVYFGFILVSFLSRNMIIIVRHSFLKELAIAKIKWGVQVFLLLSALSTTAGPGLVRLYVIRESN